MLATATLPSIARPHPGPHVRRTPPGTSPDLFAALVVDEAAYRVAQARFPAMQARLEVEQFARSLVGVGLTGSAPDLVRLGQPVVE